MALSIHLGAHKTASTHLQNSLRLVGDQLRAAGLAYVHPGMLRNATLPLSYVLAQGQGAATDAGARQALQDMRAGCRDMLISEENILGLTRRSRLFSRSGEVYPRAARRLRHVMALAGGGPTVLYLSLRDPACFMASAFALQVSRGREIEFDAYLGGRDAADIGWAELVGRLAEVRGVSRIVLWRYEDYALLRPRILARLLPAGLAEHVPDPPPANVGLTQAGYDWLLRRASALMESGAEVDLPTLSQRARLRFPPGRGHAPLRPFDEKTGARSAANYAREIAALRTMPGVELLEP